MRAAPSRTLLSLLALIGAAALAALIAGVDRPLVSLATLVAVLVLLAAVDADYVLSRRRWRAANVRFTRRLPAAFAIGVERPVRVKFEHDGVHEWTFDFYDHVDSSVTAKGLPQALALAKGKGVDAEYRVTPSRRGEIAFAPAELRVRSLLGFCDIGVRLGEIGRASCRERVWI